MPLTASAVPTLYPLAASLPKLWTDFQSQLLPAQVVANPLVVSHTLLPAATQWFGSCTSAWNGAVNREDGSQSALFVHSQPHIGEIVWKVRPPSSVLYIARLVYSPTARSALAGSTRTKPPSPPAGSMLSF